MANAGFIIGWSDTRPGREVLAAELWAGALAYYQTKVADKTIDSFEPVVLGRHGGDLNGFILIRGDQAKLDAWRRTEEFLGWTLKGIYCLEHFGIVDAYVGDGLQVMMTKWAQSLPRK